MDTHNLVLETLTNAASQDAAILKPAELQLKEWETQPGFYSILFSIFSNYEIDVNVRWITILYFKNGVERYWRKTAHGAISDGERSTLRPQLISSFKEPVPQLATQLAVLISKVARQDCPREWPELVPTLLSAVKSDKDLEQQRGLLTLHHVTKALSSKRLAGDRRLFQELTSNIFSFILQLWFHHFDQGAELIQRNHELFANSLEKLTLTLKILNKLVVHGFKDPNQNPDCMKFILSIFDKLHSYLQIRNDLEQTSNIISEKCEKYIILMTKVLIGFLEYHPFAYIPFIKPSLEVSTTYAFTETGIKFLFERFTVQCLNLIKGILLCAEYRPAKVPEETGDARIIEASNIKQEFFTFHVLTGIIRRLLSHYFLLTLDDLNSWEADAEGFASDEGGESWKYNLRPSTEALFMSLFHEFRQQLTPIILEMMKETSEMHDPANLPALLKKEAVYNAVGLAAFELYDEVDFDQWFLNTLIKELEVLVPSYKIIRRRVIFLIGQWIGVKFTPELRTELYRVILPLLSIEEDLVVRLAAADTLKLTVDDFEFNIEQFLPYLRESFDLLYKLLNQVSGCDTKMKVLYVMSYVIERVGNQIRPFAMNLVHYLPLLWNESEGHNMLRCAIITTLVHLVHGFGSTSAELYPFLCAVINYSIDIAEDPHVYLLDDGVDLWWAVLDNAKCLTPELSSLFHRMPSLLEYTSDSLKTCLNIIQAQALIGPNEFVKHNPEATALACASIFSDLKSEGIVNLMTTFEDILRIIPIQGPKVFESLLVKVFLATIQTEEYPMVMSGYLAVIGRISLQNPTVFYSLQEFVASRQNMTTEQLFDVLLDVLIDRLSVVTQIERRKLLALALASFITNGSSVVKNKMCGILLGCVEVLNDVVHRDINGVDTDSLVLTESDNIPESELETEHDKRKRALSFNDPVHTIVLSDFLKNQLDQLERNIGQAAFKEVMDAVDVETMAQLMEFVNRSLS